MPTSRTYTMIRAAALGCTVAALTAGAVLTSSPASAAPSSSFSSSSGCLTSSFVPALSWVSFRNSAGSVVWIKHAYSKARTVDYYVSGDGVLRELDVAQRVMNGRSTAIADGGISFGLRTNQGLEIWRGQVRSARNTKAVVTICGSWHQVGGRDIGLRQS